MPAWAWGLLCIGVGLYLLPTAFLFVHVRAYHPWARALGYGLTWWRPSFWRER